MMAVLVGARLELPSRVTLCLPRLLPFFIFRVAATPCASLLPLGQWHPQRAKPTSPTGHLLARSQSEPQASWQTDCLGTLAVRPHSSSAPTNELLTAEEMPLK